MEKEFGDDTPVRSADARRIVASACFPDAPFPEGPGRVGLEVERFPILLGADGGPVGRVPIEGRRASSLALLDAVSAAGRVGPRGEVRGIPAYPVRGGGRVTFEPGGAVEHATAVHTSVAAALAEVEDVGAFLTRAYADAGVTLACAGIDPWHPLDAVRQQLRSFRYPAMHAYLERRGPAGPLMMRHSCSLQVNLDLGPPGERADRWITANLLAPIVTATFANSPSSSAVSGRAVAWQALDPTRTGVPAALVDGSVADPVGQMLAAALTADVLLVRRGDDAAWPGTPGHTFGAWMAGDESVAGRPATAADLAYHLTTLFHEVRPRGFLEFRGIDALPYAWRAVPVVLLAGAIEDGIARARVRRVMEPLRARLPDVWRRAARSGVRDPELCALAVEVWSFARMGAQRLPEGYLPPGALETVDAFLDRYTARGRCPSDDLRDLLGEDNGAASLAWAAEPVPELAGSDR
jgi:glutamate--cysteine ligase